MALSFFLLFMMATLTITDAFVKDPKIFNNVSIVPIKVKNDDSHTRCEFVESVKPESPKLRNYIYNFKYPNYTGGCPPGWVYLPSTKSCYHGFNINSTCEQAEEICRRKGAQPASAVIGQKEKTVISTLVALDRICHINSTLTIGDVLCQKQLGKAEPIVHFDGIINTPCPSQWVYGAKAEKCYKAFDARLSWSEAENICNEEADGHLAVIHSEEDFEILASLTDILPYKHNHYQKWIGFSRKNSKSPWEHIDGSPVDFYKTEDMGSETENCAVLNTIFDDRTNKVLKNIVAGNCENRCRTFVCMRDPIGHK